MTENHMPWLATPVTMHSYMAEAWLARDNTEVCTRLSGQQPSPLYHRQGPHTGAPSHFRTRAKLSCKGTGEPAATTWSLRQMVP